MLNLSENYYLRKCFTEQEQVPTQSMMKKKMGPPLAAIYFKSMTPRLKEIAGLEPPLKGGGTEWYVPPKDLLQGRAVLKPIKGEVLDKLNHDGVDIIGMKLFKQHREDMDAHVKKVLDEGDHNWRNHVNVICKQEWDDLTVHALKKNVDHISNTFDYFVYLYRNSLNKIETLFHEAAIAEIQKTREKALLEMQNKYEVALKSQAISCYDEYTNKLMNEKDKLKEEFIKKLEICRTDMADKIHDLYVDKYMAIENLRQVLECQNLACRIYVALKERDECLKEMEESKYRHQKIAKKLADEIAFKELEVRLAEQKERRRQDFFNIWKNKVCHVVKKFQTFVSYCLKMLPDHAEFFLNMEKLMLLQVNEALEDPTAESIIIIERKTFTTPIPQPTPFYLFCDRGYKAEVDHDLCPKRSASSASQLPVVIINKRCLYAACDNFEQFTNKVKDFILGKRGNDADFKDELNYEHFVPVKSTSSQQKAEINLQSSLIHLLDQEIVHDIPKDEITDKCNFCRLSRCVCSAEPISKTGTKQEQPIIAISSESPGYSHSSINKYMGLQHERNPKWESFFAHVEPKKCACGKMSKKHLEANFPPYMRRMTYGPPDIPDYELCPVTTLKEMVKEARKEKTTMPVIIPCKTKDMSTQYFDPEFEMLCTCFSDNEVDRLLGDFKIDTKALYSMNPEDCRIRGVHDNVSLTYMTQRASSFATARACSLRNLVEDIPDLHEIFKDKDCTFE